MGANGRPRNIGMHDAALSIHPHAGPVDMRTLMTTLVMKLDMIVLGISANTAVLEAMRDQLAQLEKLPGIAEQLAAAVAQLESIKLPPFLTRK